MTLTTLDNLIDNRQTISKSRSVATAEEGRVYVPSNVVRQHAKSLHAALDRVRHCPRERGHQKHRINLLLQQRSPDDADRSHDATVGVTHERYNMYVSVDGAAQAAGIADQNHHSFHIYSCQPWGWQPFHVQVGDSNGITDDFARQGISRKIAPLEDLCGSSFRPTDGECRSTGLTLNLSRHAAGSGLSRVSDVKQLPWPMAARHDDFLSLADLLNDSMDCMDESNIPLTERVRLAVVLTSSVLQLYETQWLEHWSNQAIQFPYCEAREGGRHIALDQPVLQYKDRNQPVSR